MADLNKVMLIGRITSDLEVKKIGNDWNSVLNFSLVTNSNWKNKNGEKIEEADFHKCVVFWPLANMMGQYLWKWRKIFVEWKLRTRQWEDQSWNKRYTTEVIVSNMNFCDSKPSWTSNTTTSSTIKEKPTKKENTDDEDIPF